MPFLPLVLNKLQWGLEFTFFFFQPLHGPVLGFVAFLGVIWKRAVGSAAQHVVRVRGEGLGMNLAGFISGEHSATLVGFLFIVFVLLLLSGLVVIPQRL